MWHKPISLFSRFLMISVVTGGLMHEIGMVLFPIAGHAQTQGASRKVYDSVTEQSLAKLKKSLNKVNPDVGEIKQLLQQIINGSGFIEPLGEIYLRLAQNEKDGNALIGYYSIIIKNCPKSAWAQRAVVELVPLLLMSGGQWNLTQETEALLWKNTTNLLSPSPEAASLGENPQDLCADVFLQLLHLAHYRNDDAQIAALITQVPPRALIYQDQIDLAAAYAKSRMGERTKSRTAFQAWLEKYKNSDYRPLGSLALYNASNNQSQMEEALRMIDSYPDSLESLWLQANLKQ